MPDTFQGTDGFATIVSLSAFMSFHFPILDADWFAQANVQSRIASLLVFLTDGLGKKFEKILGLKILKRASSQ